MSDTARKKTDKLLKSLEEKISREYQYASDDIEDDVDEYFEKYEQHDKELQQQLADGKISKSDYTNWRLTHIARGTSFGALVGLIAERYTEANITTTAYVNSAMAQVYGINREFTVNNIVGANFSQYDEKTIERLLLNNPTLLPNYPEAKAVARGIDLAYGQSQIRASITSGILQGKSIGHIADDMQKHMETMSRSSALCTARTAFTEAENAGRLDGAQELEDMGCILKREWLATSDDRTREEHLEADGQQVDVDEPFEVGGEQLMYPGDDSLGASGCNIYNCRCSTRTICVGFTSTLPDELQGTIQVE